MGIASPATSKYMVQRPSIWQLWTASFLLAIVLMVFGTGLNRVSADGPATTQVTGNVVNEVFDPQSISYSADVSLPHLTNANGMTPNVDTVDPGNGETGPAPAEPTLYKAYTRFEVHQVAKHDLIGTLDLKGEGFNASIPYSATRGEAFSVYALFPESIGPYELKLMANGNDDPVVFVEGELDRVRDGEYQHQLIGARATPDLLVLSPEELGMIIALGSVQAKLHSCIQLFSAMDAVFDLGVDTDGDGVIEPSESVTQHMNGVSSACIETPESNIPLTSRYESKVSTPEGKLIAKNKGLYDFVNRSSINAEKESDDKAVREFKVQWIRTPMATTIEIKNSSLRPPAVLVKIMPKDEDKTEDLLRNGEDVTPPADGDLTSPHGADVTPPVAGDLTSPHEDDVTLPAAGDPSSPPNDGGSASSHPGNDAITHRDPMSFLMENWMLLALGAGLLLAAVLIARGITSTSALSNKTN